MLLVNQYPCFCNILVKTFKLTWKTPYIFEFLVFLTWKRFNRNTHKVGRKIYRAQQLDFHVGSNGGDRKRAQIRRSSGDGAVTKATNKPRKKRKCHQQCQSLLPTTAADISTVTPNAQWAQNEKILIFKNSSLCLFFDIIIFLNKFIDYYRKQKHLNFYSLWVIRA